MEQQRAINALEPFLALSKTANSPRATADLIKQATSAPNTFVFAELLHTPNIHALQSSPDHAAHHRLLQIFAWGTWADYQSTEGLPQLSQQQQDKLRLLSLLPIARSQAHLTYKGLQSALTLHTAAALEQLVTKAIYSGLISGKLDPHHQVVNITSVAPLRDLAPGSIPTLTKALDAWSEQCTSMRASLDAEIATVKSNALRKGQQSKRLQTLLDEKMAAAEKEEATRPKRNTGTMGESMNRGEPNAGDVDAMDVDQNEARTGRRAVKRGGFGLSRMH